MNLPIPTTMTTPRSLRRMVAGLGALSLAAVLAWAGPVGAAPADKAGGPPGNNGTIKIDGVEWDNHPDNEPHVGCDFEVDFYGYDKGDLYATLTFAAQPPTGNKVFYTEPEPGPFIGGNDNSGGGSEQGHDAQWGPRNFSSELSEFTPHPKQGYHVKLTVNADGSQGADTKHKVFWVEGCEPETTSNPGSNPGSNPNSNGSAIDGSNTSAIPSAPLAPGAEAGVDVMGENLAQPATAAPDTSVQGATVSGSSPAALARTGSPIGFSLLLAALALALGAVARRSGRAKAITTTS